MILVCMDLILLVLTITPVGSDFPLELKSGPRVTFYSRGKHYDHRGCKQIPSLIITSKYLEAKMMQSIPEMTIIIFHAVVKLLTNETTVSAGIGHSWTTRYSNSQEALEIIWIHK